MHFEISGSYFILANFSSLVDQFKCFAREEV